MLGFFRKIAPWLSAGAQFIPGAGPVIAGTINQIAAASGHTEVKAEGTVDSIANTVAALSGNSDAMLKLKQADQEYAAQMQAMGFKQIADLEALAVQDRESARDREKEVKDVMPRVLGAAAFALFSYCVVTVLLGYSKADSVIAGTLIGYVSAKAEQVITYYFGSSSGSDRKTELLAQAEPIKPQK